MTFAVVQTASQTATAATSITTTFTAAVANNLLVAFCAGNINPATVTVPAGWTAGISAATGTTAAGGRVLRGAYKVAVGGETSAVFAVTASAQLVTAFAEYSGAITTSPLLANGCAVAASGTAVPTPSVTPAANHRALAVFATADNAAATFSGQTVQGSATNVNERTDRSVSAGALSMAMADRFDVVPTAGSYSANATATVAGFGVGAIAVFDGTATTVAQTVSAALPAATGTITKTANKVFSATSTTVAALARMLVKLLAATSPTTASLVKVAQKILAATSVASPGTTPISRTFTGTDFFSAGTIDLSAENKVTVAYALNVAAYTDTGAVLANTLDQGGLTNVGIYFSAAPTPLVASARQSGYVGIAPPSVGPHHYVWELPLGSAPNIYVDNVLQAITRNDGNGSGNYISAPFNVMRSSHYLVDTAGTLSRLVVWDHTVTLTSAQRAQLVSGVSPRDVQPTGILFEYSTGTIVKQVNKIVAATVTTAAAVVRLVSKALAATGTTTATIVKQAQKIVTATATTLASLVATLVSGSVVTAQALLATVTATGSLGRLLILKAQAYGAILGGLIVGSSYLADGPESSGSVVAQVLSAVSTTTGTLVRLVLKALGATGTTTATVVKVVGKPVSATVTTAATVVRLVSTAVTATVTTAATVQKLILQSVLAATVTTTALLTKTFSQILTATATTTATIVRVAQKALTATATTTAAMQRLIGKLLQVTVTTTPYLIRIVPQKLAATVTTTATLLQHLGIHFTQALAATATTVADICTHRVPSLVAKAGNALVDAAGTVGSLILAAVGLNTLGNTTATNSSLTTTPETDTTLTTDEEC